jgi:hypothetical protein
MEYSGELELELLKYHYRFTDEQWAAIPDKEKAVKLAVFKIVQENPGLR